MTDWRSDKDLLHDIMMNALPPGQALYQKDRDAAVEDDRKNKRGYLILNPDLDTYGLDVEGLIIGRPGEEHKGEEYRVVVDPAMKGMKDPDTGEIRAGFWLKHQSFDPLSPIIPFAVADITERFHRQHASMARPLVTQVQPLEYPQMALFDLEEDENMPEGEVVMRQQGIPGIASSDYPDWYRPSKDRKEANMRVLQGRHPMGHALGDPATSCGDCAYLIGKEFSKTYWKCEKSKQSGGPATDIRKKWRGCEHWMDGAEVDEPEDLKRKLICDLGLEPTRAEAMARGSRFSPEAIMASPEKAAINQDIRDAMDRRCYEAWLDYYRKAENLDRIHPHAPARKGYREVTTQGQGQGRGYRKALKMLSDERAALTEGSEEEIEKAARKRADMDFDRELEPCPCSACKEARGGR